MGSRSLGLLLVAIGAAVAVIGVLVAAGVFDWFGRLPGDIRFEGRRTRVYIPIVSMVIVSLVLTVLLNLFLRR